MFDFLNPSFGFAWSFGFPSNPILGYFKGFVLVAAIGLLRNTVSLDALLSKDLIFSSENSFSLCFAVLDLNGERRTGFR